MAHIKAIFIAGLCVGMLYGLGENLPSTQENHFITVTLEDGKIELNEERWELLLSNSETLQDMFSAIKEVGPSLPLSTIKKETFEILLKVLAKPDGIAALTFAQQLDLWGCVNFLWIPLLLSPLDKIIAHGLSDGILTQFAQNPLEVMKLLELHCIDMADSGIGYAIIEPHLDDLWETAFKVFDSNSAVWSAAWSPNSKIIASGSCDGIVNIWNVYDGRILRTFSGHGKMVLSVAWSPDGEMIASGSVDGAVRICNIKDERILHTFFGDSHFWARSVLSVAWNPGGTMIASASDYAVRIWNVRDGRLLHILSDHGGLVDSVVWSSDGTMIASGSLDNTVRIWNIQDGKLRHTFPDYGSWVWSVAWSPDGTMIASGSRNGFVRIWDVRDGRLLSTLSANEFMVTSVVWSPDGAMIASGSTDGAVRIWNVHDGRLLRTLSGHVNQVNSVTWSPDSMMIASGSGDKTVRIWDMHPLFFISRITLLDALIIITTLKNPAWLKSQAAQTLIASRPWYETSEKTKEEIGKLNAKEVFNLIIQYEMRKEEEYKQRTRNYSS